MLTSNDFLGGGGRDLGWHSPRGKPQPMDGSRSRLRSAMHDSKDFHGPISGSKAAAGADKASKYFKIIKDDLLIVTTEVVKDGIKRI
jgi:hypothetical protein